MFVVEHSNEIASLGADAKYASYDDMNRAIIQNQLRYLKNSKKYLDTNIISDQDGGCSVASPADAADDELISCHVLFSGNYATAKLDQLKIVVDSVSREEAKKKLNGRPASLTFVPDA